MYLISLFIFFLFSCHQENISYGDIHLLYAEYLDQTGDVYHAKEELGIAMNNVSVKERAQKYLENIEKRKEKARDCLKDVQGEMDTTIYEKSKNKHHFQLGVCYEVLEDFDSALKEYDISIRLKPTLPIVFVRRALLKARSQNKVAALEDFAKAVELKEEYLPARLHLGLFYARNKDKENAIKESNFLRSKKTIYAEMIDYYIANNQK